MVDSLNPDQERVLSEFRRILKDEIPTKMYNDSILLMKFLKARDFNIKKAEFMIKNNVRWRKEMQVDTILTDFKRSEVLTKYVSEQFIGFDSEGCPVYYVQIGRMDPQGLFKSTNLIYFTKTAIQTAEKHVQLHRSQSEKLGEPIGRSIGIFDESGLSLAAVMHVEGLQFLLKYCRMMQDNYPEIVKRVYIINASSLFMTVWPAVQKCLATEVKKKFFVYGQDGWKEELLKIMDADVLPAFLGGNRTDPDGNPLCLNIINHLPGNVDEKYFLEKNVRKFSQKPEVKSVKIDREDLISESIQITIPTSIINWEFLIKDYDIGFGILLESADGSTEELIPVHKIETECESYIGMYRCKKPGKHLVVFDNSYSWFRCKEVYYRLWITNAEAT